MKKTLIVLVVLIVVIGMFVSGKYNSFITKDEEVKTAWGQVENVYQRRHDLIPNLVSTVKGYAEHEQETFTAVVEARAKATSTSINVNDANAMAQFQQNQAGISSALSKLMVVVEKYPDLKANQNFLNLQAQLEGTENRITTERMRYNNTVKVYNISIRVFPGNLLAGMFWFEKAVLFEADQGSEKAPVVEF